MFLLHDSVQRVVPSSRFKVEKLPVSLMPLKVRLDKHKRPNYVGVLLFAVVVVMVVVVCWSPC